MEKINVNDPIQVCFVGGGTLPLFGALLLYNFGVQSAVLEKSSYLESYEVYHWINGSSTAIFTQIPKLIQYIGKEREKYPFNYVKYFRFVENLFGYELSCVNLFGESVEYKLQQNLDIFGQLPLHISVRRINYILHHLIIKKQNVQFNKEVCKIIPILMNSYKYYDVKNSKGETIVIAKYVVFCDRNAKIEIFFDKNIIKMYGKGQLYGTIVVYFQSKLIAEEIRSQGNFAMKHFVLNKKIQGTLHSMNLLYGYFALYILNYYPYVDLLQIYTPYQLIFMIFDDEKMIKILQNSIKVLKTYKRIVSAQLINKMYHENVFFLGDSAHSFPNIYYTSLSLGLQEIHEFVHALLFVIQNKYSNANFIFNRFSSRRKYIANIYLKKALTGYEEFKKVYYKLGLTSNIIYLFSKNSLVKSVFSKISEKKPEYMYKIRLKSLSHLYKKYKVSSPKLTIFTDDFDLVVQNQSFIRRYILRNHSKQNTSQSRIYNLFVREWTLTEYYIYRQIGKVDYSNVLFYSQEGYFGAGYRMISADGTVIIF